MFTSGTICTLSYQHNVNTTSHLHLHTCKHTTFSTDIFPHSPGEARISYWSLNKWIVPLTWRNIRILLLLNQYKIEDYCKSAQYFTTLCYALCSYTHNGMSQEHPFWQTVQHIRLSLDIPINADWIYPNESSTKRQFSDHLANHKASLSTTHISHTIVYGD